MSMQLRFNYAPDCSDKQHSAFQKEEKEKISNANDKDFINKKFVKKNEDEDFTEKCFER